MYKLHKKIIKVHKQYMNFTLFVIKYPMKYRHTSKGDRYKMKTFKKGLSIILSVLMALSCFALCAYAADDDISSLKVAVASDIHTVENEEINDIYGDGMFGNKGMLVSLHDESYGVIDSFMREAIANGAEHILITGDLTNRGTAEQHKKLAAYFDAFEKETGVQIYLIPGNHDYYDLAEEGVEFFRENYYNFGFKEAYARDEKTCSYAVDLDDEYTLIAIDSNLPGKTRDGMTDELYSWIFEETAKAQARGKKVIAMMHHPLMPHFALHDVILSAFVVENWRKVASKFADAGIKYVFTGHKHVGDIAVHKSALGNEVYDISASSLLAYPIEYRLVDFSQNGVQVRTRSVTKIQNMDLIAKGHNEKALEMLSTDLPAYANLFFDESARYMVGEFVSADFLCGLIGAKDAVLYDTVDGVCNRAKKLIFAPLYGGEDSFSAIAKEKYDITVPESDYETIFDVAMVILKNHFAGDENYPADSIEMKLAVNCVAALVAYAFEGVPNDARYAIFNAIFKLLGVDPSAFGISLKALVRDFGSDGEFGMRVTSAVLEPVLNGIMVDEAPGDKNVDLPAYGEVKTEMSVDSVFAIFKKIVYFAADLLEYIWKVLSIALG